MADGFTLTAATPVPGFAKPGLTLTTDADLEIARLQFAAGENESLAAQTLGGPLPAARAMTRCGEVDVAWLAPGEWLLTGYALAPTLAALREALAQSVAMATDLTHGRVAFVLSGPRAREALAAHCPLDLSDRAFPIGAVARSLLGDAGLFIARLTDAQDGPAFRLIVDQTMAAYARRMLAGPGQEA